MLRKRIIISLLFNKGVLYRTRNFLPNNIYTHNFIDTWSVDEIVMLDISRSDENTSEYESFLELVRKISKNCFVPVSVGGKISSIEHADVYLKNGADKIVINTNAFLNPELITALAKKYGAQCVVVSVDVKKVEGKYIVFIGNGSESTGIDVCEWIVRAEEYGAGEILLNSIDKDGMLDGYDYDLYRSTVSLVGIPVIACGGAGSWKNFEDAILSGADAVCTTNIFHFTEVSMKSAKQYLRSKGIIVR